jgi:hypothetical protein
MYMMALYLYEVLARLFFSGGWRGRVFVSFGQGISPGFCEGKKGGASMNNFLFFLECLPPGCSIKVRE